MSSGRHGENLKVLAGFIALSVTGRIAEVIASMGLDNELAAVFQSGKVVVVVGAGVSKAVANLPSWNGAISSAIDHLSKTGIASKEEVDGFRKQLTEAVSKDDLIACAGQVRTRLVGGHGGSGEFPTWLKEVFDVPIKDVQDHNLIHSLLRLPVALFTTTNYDKILSGVKPGAEGVTWREPNRVVEALRSGVNTVHLHGAWDDPDSVILGREDYEKLYEDDGYRSFMRTLWLDRTLVFVGCSLDGMRDPDFARLLDWAVETFPSSTFKHYALVRTNSYTREDAERFLNRWRVQLVPYGESHDELAPYLSSFVPLRPGLQPPSPPRVFVGREEPINQLKSSIRKGESTLVHGMGGIGKTSLVATAVAEIGDGTEGFTTLWLDGRGKSALEIGKEVGRHLQIAEIESAGDQEAAVKLRSYLADQTGLHIVVELMNDVEEAHHFVRDHVPPSTPVTVLARRRSSGFQTYIQVEPLDSEASEAAFCANSGIAPGQSAMRETTEILEGHPLALALAAARVVVEDLPLDQLKRRLAETKTRLSTLREADREDSSSTSVSASLQVSFENLPENLLRTVATLAHFHSDVTVDLLAVALGIDEAECEDFVGGLVSRSIVSRDRYGIVHLHPLVRDFVLALIQADGAEYRSKIEDAFVKVAKNVVNRVHGADRTVINNIDDVLDFISNSTSGHSTDRQLAAVHFTDALFRPYGIAESYAATSISSSLKRTMIDHCIGLIGAMPMFDLRVALLVCKAQSYADERDHQAAVAVLEQAEATLIEGDGDLAHRSFIKCEIANQLCELYRFPEAEQVMRDGLELARQSGNESSMAQLNGQLGMVLLRSGNLAQALVYYGIAKDLYVRLQDFRGVAACLYNMADIARSRGNCDAAWNLDCEGLEAEIEADNVMGSLSSLERLAGHVGSECQLDYVLSKLGEVVPSLPPATLRAHPGVEASIRGVAYAGIRDMVTARQHLEQALDARVKAGDHRGAAVVLGNMSSLALQEKQLLQAWDLNERSRQEYEAANDLRGVLICGLNGIEVAASRDDDEGAIIACASAVHTAASMNDIQSAVQALSSMPIHVLSKIIAVPPERNDLSTTEAMEFMSQAAIERDMGRIVGLVEVLVNRDESRVLPSDGSP